MSRPFQRGSVALGAGRNACSPLPSGAVGKDAPRDTRKVPERCSGAVTELGYTCLETSPVKKASFGSEVITKRQDLRWNSPRETDICLWYSNCVQCLILGSGRTILALILDVLRRRVMVDGQVHSRVVFILRAWVWYRLLHTSSSPAICQMAQQYLGKKMSVLPDDACVTYDNELGIFFLKKGFYFC